MFDMYETLLNMSNMITTEVSYNQGPMGISRLCLTCLYYVFIFHFQFALYACEIEFVTLEFRF